MAGVNLDRLRRQVMSNQEAEHVASELEAAREVIEAICADAENEVSIRTDIALDAYDRVVSP